MDLVQHPVACIDQNHRKICGRCTGGHVPGVLLVPRRIGDNELTILGRKEPIGDVDGDALFTFCP